MVKTVHRIVPMLLILLCFGLPFFTVAQDDEDDSKSIKAERFVKGRPADKSRNSATYRRVTKSSNGTASIRAKGMDVAQLGITIWRFRPSQAADKTKELVEEEEGRQSEWTLERVEEGTALSPGQRVRLSIESLSRDGYLYVIDREGYADNTLGDPVLIFPNQRSAAANYVQAGRLIYIPSATGRFRIKPSESSKEHVAEVLTLIVSPTPLFRPDQLGQTRTPLDRKQVEEWQKRWNAAAWKFELDGGVGQAMTPTEQIAARQNAALLKQNDPAPQTVFQVAIKPNEPLMITVPLKFAKRN